MDKYFFEPCLSCNVSRIILDKRIKIEYRHQVSTMCKQRCKHSCGDEPRECVEYWVWDHLSFKSQVLGLDIYNHPKIIKECIGEI
jgi:hypothetical protein